MSLLTSTAAAPAQARSQPTSAAMRCMSSKPRAKSLRRRQAELEAQLLADPADTWPEAAAKAQYLIRLYASTADAQDARRKQLIARALADLARLIDRDTS